MDDEEDRSLISITATVPVLPIGNHSLHVLHYGAGASLPHTAFIFPVIASTDVSTVGLGGGLEAMVKGYGLAGWNVDADLRGVGCYPTLGAKWDKTLGPFITTNTDTCVDACSGYRYVGLTNGDTCHCGNELSVEAVTSDKCNMYCVADPNLQTKCGGKYYTTVWERCCHPEVFLAPADNTWDTYTFPYPPGRAGTSNAHKNYPLQNLFDGEHTHTQT